MLVVNPVERASLKEVMNHPWMTKGFDGPPPHYLPHRVPLKLPLNYDVIDTIVELQLGTEDQVTRELTEILGSPEYHLAVRNWNIKNNVFEDHSLELYDEKIPDPTIGYHPLISIYYLVYEMRQRKKLNEEAYKSHIQSLQERKLQQKQQQQQQQQLYSQPQSSL
ncbi:unnamed protein product [[Candida] boidinii]|nr:unnamed protein product [[Candida] boidinii]